MSFLETLSNPFVFGIVVGLCMLLLTYLDTKITKKERNTTNYFKVFLAASFVSGGLKFLVSNVNINMSGGNMTNKFDEDVSSNGSVKNVTEKIEKIRKTKNIYLDNPDF
jgi:hypothetical protein